MADLHSSHVSFTACVRKSIQRRSGVESINAVRREVEEILIVCSSSWQIWSKQVLKSQRIIRQVFCNMEELTLINISLYRSFCCKSKELVDPTI